MTTGITPSCPKATWSPCGAGSPGDSAWLLADGGAEWRLQTLLLGLGRLCSSSDWLEEAVGAQAQEGTWPAALPLPTQEDNGFLHGLEI